MNVQSATKVFATFVPVAHIFQAIENTLLIVHPDAGVCQVAVVEFVAVRTCPVEGAVAPLTDTVVVADFSQLVIPEVNPVAVPVRLVPTQDIAPFILTVPSPFH